MDIPRRRSAAESLNNFSSSVARSVNYLSQSFDANHANIHVHLPEPEYGSEVSPLIETNSNAIYEGPELTPVASYETAILLLKSSPIQTVFNSTNVLIGLGIFSIPLAFHYSGWICGFLILTFSAFSTNRTAVILGDIMSRHSQLRSYQDIGVYCYGSIVGFMIVIIFAFDLYGAGISMVLLFSDSLNALMGWDKTVLKSVCCFILMVLNFMPLRILSFLSLMGILCTSSTCLIIILSGFVRSEHPGSLLDYMPTNVWPVSTTGLLFSLGLFMAPWGGHATFPEIYIDQEEPEKYGKCMSVSFGFSYAVDLLTGIVGFLMFGSTVQGEVTNNILMGDYPKLLQHSLVLLMGLLPISKLPLMSRPILTILDQYFPAILGRMILSGLYLGAACVFQDFSSVVALLGAGVCFTVCIVLPSSFAISEGGGKQGDSSRGSFYLWWGLIVVGGAGAILGTLGVLLRG